MQSYTAKLTPGEDGWIVVECVELPGVITQGKTKAEAMANFREAVELWLESFGPPAQHPELETIEIGL